MKTVSIVCQTTKTLTPENPEDPVNKGFHEPNNTKMYNPQQEERLRFIYQCGARHVLFEEVLALVA